MRSFYFQPGKTAVFALFMGLLAVIIGKLWWSIGGILPLSLALVFSLAAVKLAFDAMSNDPALKFDGKHLWVRKAFGGMDQVPWSEVQGISLEGFTIRYWGIIPLGKTEYLSIACNGGVLGTRRLRVAVGSIALPPGGSGALVHILQLAHVEAVGLAGVAMAGAGRQGWGAAPAASAKEEGQEDGSGFDADAAIARYLASKDAGGDQPASGQAPPARPAMPPRPVFGRRVSSS